MKKAKTILLLTILLFGVFLTINFVRAAELAQYQGTWEEEQPKDKALEIVYPKIPGDTTTITIASGLPEYVDYILKFAMLIIGFVILGALIYSGIQWLTSTGKPEQLTSAKQGIFSAFLGAIILFSAYLIFNTINPQLTILELPDPDIIEPIVTPGIYLCDYDAGDINAVIERYKSEDQNARINAAEELKKLMIKEENGKGTCFKVTTSDNLKNFVFKPKDHTAFAIPRKEYVYDETTKKIREEWFYDYGLILHQKDNRKGRCKLAGLYENKIDPHPNLVGFDKVKSVTLFQKPEIEPSSDNLGVILYQCLNYNDGTLCPGDVIGTLDWASFKPENDILYVPKGTQGEEEGGDFGKFGGGEGGGGGGGGASGTFEVEGEVKKQQALDQLAENTRSIQIDPTGSYFAIMFSEDKFTGDVCEVITTNDNNLLDRDIGRCGILCNKITDRFGEKAQLKFCGPCLKSMYVVKGQVISR